MNIKEIFKNIIRFIFRKRIAELKAKQIADKMIDSMRIETTPTSGGIKSTIENMKKSGIKKVELICVDDCDCCKDLKNKQIPIENIKPLPMKECPFAICRGRYTAVVEFDLS